METQAQQADTVDALRTAASAMRALRAQMPLADVEKLLEESVEGAEYVVRMLSRDCLLHAFARKSTGTVRGRGLMTVSARQDASPLLRDCDPIVAASPSAAPRGRRGTSSPTLNPAHHCPLRPFQVPVWAWLGCLALGPALTT